jgi:hypothetical protein
MAASNAIAAPKAGEPGRNPDDVLTICAISIVAGILTNVLHEGLGHGLTALLTGAESGVLTTVAWSSAFDSRLVEAGGTLANLAAGVVLWLLMRRHKGMPLSTRYFLVRVPWRWSMLPSWEEVDAAPLRRSSRSSTIPLPACFHDPWKQFGSSSSSVTRLPVKWVQNFGGRAKKETHHACAA